MVEKRARGSTRPGMAAECAKAETRMYKMLARVEDFVGVWGVGMWVEGSGKREAGRR